MKKDRDAPSTVHDGPSHPPAADGTKDRALFARYSATLVANFFTFVSGVINASIVPRVLRPAAYGDYQFIKTNSIALLGFLNLSASNAFYTHSARHRKSGIASRLFGRWLGLETAVFIVVLGLLLLLNLQGRLYPGQAVWMIIALSVVARLDTLFNYAMLFGESKAESVVVQGVRVVQKLSLTVGVLLFWWFGNLHVVSFMSIEAAAGMVGLILLAYRLGVRRPEYFRDEPSLDKSAVQQFFYTFCRPLIVLQGIGMINAAFGRWLLQSEAGSLEQGYYSIAFQWRGIVFLATNAILNVVWTEVAHFQSKGNTAKVRTIFESAYTGTVLLGVVLSVAIAIVGSDLLLLLAGGEYEGARLVFPLVLLSSTYYTLGNLVTVVFYGSARVKLHRNVAAASALFNMVMTYWLVADPANTIAGLGLGATGLGLALFLHSLGYANVGLFFVARILGTSYRQLLLLQLRAGLVAATVALLVSRLSWLVTEPWIRVGLIGGSFVAVMAMVAVVYPELFGFRTSEITARFIREVRARLRRDGVPKGRE